MRIKFKDEIDMSDMGIDFTESFLDEEDADVVVAKEEKKEDKEGDE